jgi:hypothetical protein
LWITFFDTVATGITPSTDSSTTQTPFSLLLIVLPVTVATESSAPNGEVTPSLDSEAKATTTRPLGL